MSTIFIISYLIIIIIIIIIMKKKKNYWKPYENMARVNQHT
jgi:hypothetical protein